MTVPLTLNETLRETHFVPHNKLVVYIATSEFDAVWRRDEKGKIVQFMDNLPQCREDCSTLRFVMKRYQITDTGPDHKYNMDNNPTKSEYRDAMKDISKRARDHPDENFLVFYIIAGHGMVFNGKTILILNEFDPSESFYKYAEIEQQIRRLAYYHPNMYQVGFFACCREILNRNLHSGGFSAQRA